MTDDSLISRAAAAIAEVMAAAERDADQTLGTKPSAAALEGRKALALMIARSLHGRGLLRDPDDTVPVYRGDGR